MTTPRLFISYSWSTPEHENWVLELATQLTDQGIEVIFDKWDLKEGHDSYVFMEKMVTDPTVTKVVIVSDILYAKKANDRSGGVGTETQIISKEVYERATQSKFVAIVPEKGPDGVAPLPIYYTGRIYIDFSDPSKFIEKFEQLVRWAYDKRVYERPPLGKPPAFLNDESHARLGNEVQFKRCIDAIRNNKPFVNGATDEYLDSFINNLENFRIVSKDGVYLDEIVIKSIEDFQPYRDQNIQLIISITQYSPTLEYVQKLHRFFERLLPFMERPENIMSWDEDQVDNFRFIIHEAFLYLITIFINAEKFDLAKYIFETPYFIPGRSEAGKNAMVDFRSFFSQARSFERRNQRINNPVRRRSLRADILNERSKSSGYPFNALMQADFIAYLQAQHITEGWGVWWPETLVYSVHSYSAFEKFARASSKSYFDRFKVLLKVETADEFREFSTALDAQTSGYTVPRWDYDRISIPSLSGATTLATRP